MSNNTAPLDLLDLPDATARLADSPMGHTLHFHPSVPSTMPMAHALAATAPSGTIILADEQTAGRGRLQRRWDAPPGRGLLMSVLIKPPHLPGLPAQLPMIAGLAVVNGLLSFLKKETGAPHLPSQGAVGLKWPNDILLTPKRPNGPAGKVCGLLIESALTGSVMDHAVLGIGINVNQTAAELPPVPAHRPQPTSLALALGRTPEQPVNRTDLLVEICHALADLLAAQPQPTPAAIHTAWQDHLLTLGQVVTLQPTESGPPFTGTAIATTQTGDLILRSPAGEERRFSAGDVSTAARA